MFVPLDGLTGNDAGDAAPSATSATDTEGGTGGPETGAAEGGSGSDARADGGSSPRMDAGDEDASPAAADSGDEGEAGDESTPLGPVAFVQVAASTPGGSVHRVSATFAQQQSAGDLNVVAIGWNDTTADIADVSDSSGNVYQLAVGPTQLGQDLTQAIYYAPNIAAADAAANVVTVTFATRANVVDLRVLEYSGLDPVAPFDGASDGSGDDQGPAASGTVSTSAARSLLVGAGMTTDAFTDPGTGYTMRQVTDDGDMVEDMVVSSPGSYDAEASVSSSCEWVIQVAAFH
ncbi:MAG TPA: hypothetical protein VMI75_19775 [Polyangiaceae bacterium]|nr:hypothetical protein [Polyangiaceae bacterium]